MTVFDLSVLVFQGTLHNPFWWSVVRHGGPAALFDGDAWEEYCCAGDGLSYSRLPHTL